MKNKEIIETLKMAIGYNTNDFCISNIANTFNGTQLSKYQIHYMKMRDAIEKLPWISIKDKLPDNEEEYLTLLDCNEHEILTNRYRNGYWDMFNTHVCYWMPIPKDNDEEIDYQPSKMNWYGGGCKL